MSTLSAFAPVLSECEVPVNNFSKVSILCYPREGTTGQLEWRALFSRPAKASHDSGLVWACAESHSPSCCPCTGAIQAPLEGPWRRCKDDNVASIQQGRKSQVMRNNAGDGAEFMGEVVDVDQEKQR